MVWQFSHKGKGTDYGLVRGSIDLDIARPEFLSGTLPPPPSPVEDEIAVTIRAEKDGKIYAGTSTLKLSV
jgi:hypothetical protein